jgi:hypothetical protein
MRAPPGSPIARAAGQPPTHILANGNRLRFWGKNIDSQELNCNYWQAKAHRSLRPNQRCATGFATVFFDDLNTVINIIRCTALAEPIPANYSKFSY